MQPKCCRSHLDCSCKEWLSWAWKIWKWMRSGWCLSRGAAFLRIHGNHSFFIFFSIRSSLGSILNLDIACSTHTFHAQPASASTPFMWHENYAKLSWKLKAFSAVWSEWKRVEEWSLIVVACNKTMLRWSYTVYDCIVTCMITHDSMSLGSALRATSLTEAACYNRSTLPHFSSTYHLEHLTSEVRQGCSN